MVSDHELAREHEFLLELMQSLAKLDSLQDVCACVAEGLVGLGCEVAVVWVRDMLGPEGRGWGASASSSGRAYALEGGSPRAYGALPKRVLAELDPPAQALHRDVDARALGLDADVILPHVSCTSASGESGVGAWVGLCGAAAASPGSRRLARLVAQHLLTTAMACSARARARDVGIKYRTMVEQLPAITYYRDFTKPGQPTYMSEQVEDMLGYPREHFVENRTFFVERLHPEDRARVLELQARRLREGFARPSSVDYRMVHRDGHTVWLRNYTLAACDDAGEELFVLGIIFDVSDIKQLEQDYLHAQKMEAVGRLAGGIAHDFNNILAVIVGHTEFAQEALEPGSQGAEDLRVVLDATEQARRLVAQLLAFSRRQVLRSERLEIAALLERMRAMVGRVLREDIEFEVRVEPELGAVMADRGQLEQIVMNLLVNARDAMPEGGRLGLEARNVCLDAPPRSACEPIAPGEYVMFSVSDTGVGIDDYTRERLFEPFFTTKQQGTGLGLSTVLGLVRQHGGTLAVVSELGRGTRMEVYLPRAPPAVETPGA